MKARIAGISGACLTACALLVAAPSHAITPFGTVEPATIAPMALEAEAAYEYNHFNGDEGGNISVIDLRLITGVVQGVDVGIKAPYVMLDPKAGDSESGFGDLVASVKWNFLPAEGEMPSLALKVDYLFDTGDEEKGLGKSSPELTASLLCEKEFKPVTLTLNAGYTSVMDAEEGEEDSILKAALEAKWEAAEHLILAADIEYETAEIKDEDDFVAALVGVEYEISEGVGVDAGVRFGLSDTAPDWGAVLAVTMEFGEKGE